MGLRLALIGLVATMGIDPPSGADLSHWTRCGQTWLCSTMDDWNPWTPLEAELGPHSATDSQAVATTIAQADTCCDRSTPCPAAQRAEDKAFSDLLDELVVSFQGTTPAPAEAIVEAKAPTPQPAPAASQPETPAVRDAPVADFWGPVPTAIVPMDEEQQPAPALAADVTTPATVITVVEDEELAEVPASLAARFEPFEVADDLYPGVAFALNRESNELPPVEAPAPVAVAADEPVQTEGHATIPSRGDRLATAVHLTGEAFRAWATLLKGPAVVSIRP